jgi:hypothetical protein
MVLPGSTAWVIFTSSVTTPTVIYSTASARAACSGSAIGDGWCDDENNNAQCSYDGGDCCEGTCVSGLLPCGSWPYDCISPGAPRPIQAPPTAAPTVRPTTVIAAKSPTPYPSSYPSSHPTLGPVKQVQATGWMQVLSFSVRDID